MRNNKGRQWKKKRQSEGKKGGKEVGIRQN